jgi:sugar lactone lactonase YvrE
MKPALSSRLVVALVGLLAIAALPACDDPTDFVLPVPAKLRLAELPAAQRVLVRAEIEGTLIPRTELVFDEDRTALRGVFQIATDVAVELPVTVRVLGRLRPDGTEVVLALAQKTLAVKPREVTRLELRDDDWRIDGADVFDPNGNGAPSVDDLVLGFDPAPPGRVLDVSPADLQFPSGTRTGAFTRQIVLVENVSGLPQEVTAAVAGAQGMSIVRVDSTGTPEAGAPRTLPSFTLQPFSEQLFAVTFAPTNGFLARGSLALQTRHAPSEVTSVERIGLFANSDGEPQPVPAGYDPGVLDGAALGFDGVVQAYPPALLFGGQPLAPGVIPRSLSPDDVLVVEPLAYARATVGDVPASAVFLVQIPPRHRLSVELAGLVDDADLGLFLLDGDALAADPAGRIVARNPHTSPEVAQFRNTSPTEARRAVVVVGRRDGRENPGAPADPTDVVPFQLLAQLNAGPELADVAPLSVTTSPFRGGQEVEIRGFAFEPGATVRFGSHVADRTRTTVSDDGTVVRCVTPAADEGDVGVPLVVIVTNPDGQAATHPPVFLYDPPAPVIDAVDPLLANVAGGTPLVIRGAFFSGENGGPYVLVGGARATDVVRVSAAELQAVAPPGVAGPSSVVVENVDNDGGVTRSAAFPLVYVADQGPSPVLTAVEPAQGGVDGGDVVVLRGANFTVASAVRFGGTNAAGVVFTDASTLSCLAPPRSEGGVVDVVVINPDGRVALLADGYEYVTPPPRVFDSVPDLVSQRGGTRLFVDGGDLRPGVTALFRQGGLTAGAAGVTFVSSSRIIVTSPAGLAPGPVELVVVNPDAQVSEPLALEVIAPAAAAPRMVSASPGSVRIDNLVPVTITGTGFDDGLLLFVNDTAVPVTGLTTTSFTFEPPALAPGVATLRVVNGDGQTDARAFIYEPPLSPVFFSVTPDAVSALIPGDVVTCNGLNLGVVPAAELAGRVRIEGADGATYASTVLEQTATSLRLRIDDELPDGDGYRVVVDYPPVAATPTFAAFAPVVLSQQVIGGQPIEGSAFSVLVQGVGLNKDSARLLRFRQARAGAPDLIVDVPVTVATTTLVRADLPADTLAQGTWTTALVFEFVDASGAPDALVLEVPGDLVVSGACGNGVVDAGELCDGAELDGASCATRGFFGGVLACTSSCVFDTRQCDRCGDGIVDAADGEECDGANLDATTCADLIPGSTSGTPGCSTRCQLTAGSCATCGNGIAEGGEQCDGTDLVGQACSDVGFNAGQLTCDPLACTLDIAGCSTCGDNRCDTFESRATCPADCVATCGNNTCDTGESCTTCPRDCGGQCTAPFSLVLVGGDGQSRRFATDLTNPLVVNARDAQGAPLVGVRITFTPPPGGAVTPAVALTDASGNASTVATLPRAVGTFAFGATGTGPDALALAGAPLSVSATSQDLAPGAIATIANLANVTTFTALVDATGTPLPGLAATRTPLSLDASGNSGVAVRSDGAVFVADMSNHRVVRIDPDGGIVQLAGGRTANQSCSGGAGTCGDNGPARLATFNLPRCIALDAQDNIYVCDQGNNRVRRIDATTGIITNFAGGGTSGQANDGDGTLASGAFVNQPVSIAFAPNGDAFIASAGSNNIRRVAASTQTISTAIPTGTCTGAEFRVSSIGSMQLTFAPGPAGRLHFIATVFAGSGCAAPSGDNLLRLEPDGTVTSLAGGTQTGDNIAARGAILQTPTGLAVDAGGNAFVSERGASGRRIRRVSNAGIVRTIAGTAGVSGSSGDGGPAAAALLNTPGMMALAPGGDLLFTDLHHVRLIRAVADARPVVLDVARIGDGQEAPVGRGLAQTIGIAVTDGSGAGVPGLRVRFTAPSGATVEPATATTDGLGRATVAAFLGRQPGPQTFSIAADGPDGVPLPGSPFTITATATDVAPGTIVPLVNQLLAPTAGRGDSDGAATRTVVSLSNTNNGLVVDPDDGTIYLADAGNHRILRIDPTGRLTQVAGSASGATGATGDGGPALNALFNFPRGLALDADKNLYVADTNNNAVRVIRAATGLVERFAGTGATGTGEFGDGLPGPLANLSFPFALAIDPDDQSLIIADAGHDRLRRVAQADPATPGTPSTITTIARVGGNCSAAVGVTFTSLVNTGGLAFDHAGRLYFVANVSAAADCPLPGSSSYVLRREPDGTLRGIAGGLVDRASGPSIGTLLATPAGLAVDEAGNLYVAEQGADAVRRIDVLGEMTTVVGTRGSAGLAGDYGAATAARLANPVGLAFDGAGDLLVLDEANNTLRSVRALGQVTAATARLELDSGDDQTIVIGQATATPLRVRVVRNGANTPLVSFAIPFTAANPGDHVFAPLTTTDTSGFASTSVRIGRTTGSLHGVTVTATTLLEDIPLDGAPLTFRLTGVRPASLASTVVMNTLGALGTVPADGSGASIPATLARASLDDSGLALAADGTLYVADRFNHRIVTISPEGVASVFAGSGASGFVDNTDRLTARFASPRNVAIDAAGNVYVSDSSNRRVRKIDLVGNVTTLAGGNAVDPAAHGDGTDPAAVNFSSPDMLIFGPDGALYVSDDGHNNIRRIVVPDGARTFAITTPVTTDVTCTAATGLQPRDISNGGLAFDEQGRLLFAASVNTATGCAFPGSTDIVMRTEDPLDGARVDRFTLLVGSAVAANTGDGLPGNNSRLAFTGVRHLVRDPTDGDLYWLDTNHRLRRLPGGDPTQPVSTVLGTFNTTGFSAFTLPGAGLLSTPVGLVRDPTNGDLYLTDTGTETVRLFVP